MSDVKCLKKRILSQIQNSTMVDNNMLKEISIYLHLNTKNICSQNIEKHKLKLHVVLSFIHIATTTITYPPQTDAIEVNHTRFLHCVASYDPRLHVTYVWYENDVVIDFELVFRLGEDKYEMWYNPHFKRVRKSGLRNNLFIWNNRCFRRAL